MKAKNLVTDVLLFAHHELDVVDALGLGLVLYLTNLNHEKRFMQSVTHF